MREKAMLDRTTSQTKTAQAWAAMITRLPRMDAEGTIIVSCAGPQINAVTVWTFSSDEGATSNPLQNCGKAAPSIYGVMTFPNMAADGITISSPLK